jgi:hypothetical protein
MWSCKYCLLAWLRPPQRKSKCFPFKSSFFISYTRYVSFEPGRLQQKKTEIVWTFCISRFFNIAASNLHALLGAPISPPDRLGKDRCHAIFILPSSILYNFGSYRGPKVAYNLIFTCMQHLRRDKIVFSWKNPQVYLTVHLGFLFPTSKNTHGVHSSCVMLPSPVCIIHFFFLLSSFLGADFILQSL